MCFGTPTASAIARSRYSSAGSSARHAGECAGTPAAPSPDRAVAASPRRRCAPRTRRGRRGSRVARRRKQDGDEEQTPNGDPGGGKEAKGHLLISSGTGFPAAGSVVAPPLSDRELAVITPRRNAARDRAAPVRGHGIGVAGPRIGVLEFPQDSGGRSLPRRRLQIPSQRQEAPVGLSRSGVPVTRHPAGPPAAGGRPRRYQAMAQRCAMDRASRSKSL